jgi:transcriptional regulator with XRE-family HTH domain
VFKVTCQTINLHNAWHNDYHELSLVHAERLAKDGPVPASPRRAHAQQRPGQKSLSEALAKNVRDIRGLREFSQDDIAERMSVLGHPWSRQTTSDVERASRNVTVDELLGLALVLGSPVGELLDPRGPLHSFHGAVDPGDPGLPYAQVRDPSPVEIPGTSGIGIHPTAFRALIESRVALSLVWAEGATSIQIEPVEGHLEDFNEIVAEYRRRATKGEDNEGDA